MTNAVGKSIGGEGRRQKAEGRRQVSTRGLKPAVSFFFFVAVAAPLP